MFALQAYDTIQENTGNKNGDGIWWIRMSDDTTCFNIQPVCLINGVYCPRILNTRIDNGS